MAKISIVVAVYNSEPYLRECIDSIVNQTFKDIEIICVNDGSTDCSLAILKEYASRDDRIHVLSKENEGKGAASARNMGIDNANGEYLLVLDSDDFFELDMVEKLVAKIDQTDADVVVYGAKWFDHKRGCNTGSYKPIRLDLAPKEVFNYTDCSNHIFQIGDAIAWNKIYKMDLIKKHDLKFEAIPISDDQYVPCLAMVLADRISIVNEQLLNYRFNTGSGQTDSRTKHPDSAYTASWSIIDAMKRMGVYTDVKQSYLNLCLPLIRWYYDSMSTFEAFEYLHNKLKRDVFEKLEVLNLPSDYFYDDKLYKWLRMIMDNTAAEVAFKAAYKLSRFYGPMQATTAILRF